MLWNRNYKVNMSAFFVENFEESFADPILKRGLFLFKTGKVSVVKTSSEISEFDVIGTQASSYPVIIRIKDGQCVQASCACFYNQQDLCKHIAAAFFHINRAVLGISVNPPKTKTTTSKRTTKDEKAQELLQNLNPDQMIQFIRSTVLNDTQLRNVFLAEFTPSVDHGNLKSQIRSIIAPFKRKRYIPYASSGKLIAQFSPYENRLSKAIDAKDTSELELAWAILEVIVPCLSTMDDSGGCTLNILYLAKEIIQSSARDNWLDEQERKAIFQRAYKHFTKESFKGWDEHVLMLEVISLTGKTKSELEKAFDLTREYYFEGSWNPEFAYTAYRLVLEKQEKSEQILQLDEETKDAPFILKRKLKSAYNSGEWETAYLSMAKLLQDNPRSINPEEFFEIATKARPKVDINTFTPTLFNGCHSKDDFHRKLEIYLNHFSPQEKEKGLMQLVPILEKYCSQFLHVILAFQENWSEVIRYLETGNNVYNIFNLDPPQIQELHRQFPEELFDVLNLSWKRSLNQTHNRGQYKQVVKDLKFWAMNDMENLAQRLLDEAKRGYPQRIALQDELEKSSFRLGLVY